MQDHSVHKVGDLAGEERFIVERWLGRALANDETISLNVYRPHTPPDHATRQSLRRAIMDQAREIGSRGRDLTETEREDMIGEAFDNIRRR